MGVYVDRAENALGRMKMCHMLADSLDELHAMADRIGLKRAWFQPNSSPHYDVSKERRKLAIQYGAVEVTNKELVAVIKRLRAQRLTAAVIEKVKRGDLP